MKHLALFLFLLPILCFGQDTKTPFALTSPTPIPFRYAWTNNGLWIDSTIKATKYATSDTTYFFTFDSNGYGILRKIYAGGVIDSSIYQTVYGVDTAKQNIRGQIALKFNITDTSNHWVGLARTITINNVLHDLSQDVVYNITRVDSSNYADTAYYSLNGGVQLPQLVDSLANYIPLKDTGVIVSTEYERIRDSLLLFFHINDTNNPHKVTLQQSTSFGNSTDTNIIIGSENHNGIVVAVGNSITADIYTNPAPFPYFRYVSYWNDLNAISHAHGGATYYRGYTPHNNNGGLMDSFSVLETMPTDNSTLIIELGFNDACQYATSFDTIQMMNTLDSFVTGAITTKSWKPNRIIALSTWYIPSVSVCSNMTYAMLENINMAIKNKCAQLGIHYGDIYSEFVNRQQSNLWWTDNVHWWDMGHLIAANVIQKEMYGKLAVNGSVAASTYYDNNGNQVINTDSTGAKILPGKTGFDSRPSNRSLVTIPYTKYYAGLKAGEITFQALSPYNYIQGYNIYHDGTNYLFDTVGYGGMWQFAQGEYSWWQTTNTGNAGGSTSLEKRIKISSLNRLCGFGGNPGNAGNTDFSGSAIVTNSNTIYLNFTTKFKYAPSNTSGLYNLLVWNNADSNTQTINSLPYSFIANRLKYSGGSTFYVPVFSGYDSLVASDIRDSSNHIGISQNPLSYSRFAIPYSDSMLSAKIGYWNIGSISSSNMYISNNSYFKRGTGTICIDTAYDMNFGLYNSRTSSGACFLIGGTPYLQNGGQVRGVDYAFFKVTNWGTSGIGAHASTSNNDTFGCSIIVTNTTSDPSTRDSIFLPNLATWSGTSKGYTVVDLSGARGKIPNKRLDYVTSIPQSDVTNLSNDSVYVRNDSIFQKRNAVETFRYKIKTSYTDSVTKSNDTFYYWAGGVKHFAGLDVSATGGGGVSSFSSGNLPPLFTTSVSNSTTTPALSYSLSNAGAHKFFGNNTSSTAAPDYVSITTADLPKVDSAKYSDTAKYALTAGNAVNLNGHASSYYLPANAPITGATKTKITYDANGIVTAGADATTADIAASTNKNYVTDAQLTVIGNTSGTNTGDQTITLTGDVTGSGTGSFATTIGSGKVTNTMLAGSIAASNFVGTDIATVGTVTSGTWNATIISPTYGGTGVNNGSKTITLSGNTAIGSSTNTVALATSGNTSVTLPTSGTLATLTGSETLTNKTLTAPVISSITNTGTLTLPTVTGTLMQYAEGSTTSASSITPTGDARQNWYDVTALATSLTINAPSGTPANHNLLTIRLYGTSSQTLTFNSIFRAGTTVAMPTATTASKTMRIQCEYNSANSKWDIVGVVDGF